MCKSGNKVSLPEEVGEVFRDYYLAIYVIPNTLEKSSPELFRQKIEDYLDSADLPRLSLTDLDKPITQEEFELFLRDMQEGQGNES